MNKYNTPDYAKIAFLQNDVALKTKKVLAACHNEQQNINDIKLDLTFINTNVLKLMVKGNRNKTFQFPKDCTIEKDIAHTAKKIEQSESKLESLKKGRYILGGFQPEDVETVGEWTRAMNTLHAYQLNLMTIKRDYLNFKLEYVDPKTDHELYTTIQQELALAEAILLGKKVTQDDNNPEDTL